MTQQATATMPQNAMGQPQAVSAAPNPIVPFQTFWKNQQAGMMKRFFNDDKKRADRFFNSLMECLNDNPALQGCDPAKVFEQSLKATVLGLSLLKVYGHAYLVPYNGIPQLQLGYKGLLQLALSSGQYRVINAGVVYEGQFLGRDMLTGDIILDYNAKVSDKVVGYFAYFEAEHPKTRVVMRHSEYMSVEEMAAHAKAYVKTLKNVTYDALLAKAQDKQPSGIGWMGNFETMAIKTVLKKILKWGNMSSEIADAFSVDSDEVSAEDRHTQIINSASQPVDDMTFEDVDNAPSAQPTF